MAKKLQKACMQLWAWAPREGQLAGADCVPGLPEEERRPVLVH